MLTAAALSPLARLAHLPRLRERIPSAGADVPRQAKAQQPNDANAAKHASETVMAEADAAVKEMRAKVCRACAPA